MLCTKLLSVAAFACAGGDMPFGCALSQLPAHGFVRNLRGSDIVYDGASISDPLCRLQYQPDGFVKGNSVDALELSVYSHYDALARVAGTLASGRLGTVRLLPPRLLSQNLTCQ